MYFPEDALNVTERSSIQPFHPRCGASWTPQTWFPSKFDCSSDHHLQPVDLQVWLPKLFQGLGIFSALVCWAAHWGQPHWIRLKIWFHHFHIKKYYHQYCLGQGVWQEHVGGNLNENLFSTWSITNRSSVQETVKYIGICQGLPIS